MIVSFLTEADPLAFLAVVLILSLVSVYVGYTLATRAPLGLDNRDEAAFGLGQAAVFGLIALLLAFSFSFAAERFEARRAILVQEAVASGDVQEYALFLPVKQRETVRNLLHDYLRARLADYARINHPDAPASDSESVYEHMAELVAADVRGDPRNLGYQTLATSLNEMGKRAQEQNAALTNHVPIAILGIVLFSTLLGAGLLGLTFGRVRAPNRALCAIFCLLFAATVYAIVDLDHPRGGFIGVDVTPLQAAYASER
jgi:hypothetical protein